MNDNDNLPESNRRDFLKNTSLATLMAMMGGIELRAQDAAKPAAPAEAALTTPPPDPTVRFGVIGLGARGREVLKELALFPNTPVTAICDNYHSSLHRAAGDAPTAEQFEDYEKLLDSKNVDAVVIATPTPAHCKMVLAALQAGKHVYCEAPLANTVEDTKAIAKAARDAVKLVFQPGLQERSHPERLFLMPFIRSGALGDAVMLRAQSHQKNSWFKSSPNPEHEQALNWRLHQATSTGLMGEIGIHQIDAAGWFLKARPAAVTGFGSVMHWKDGRDVADTVQGVFEFPGGINLVYDATLCNSFDKDYEMYYGTSSAIMYRDAKAWLFYESGAELGGWEVYARKDSFYDSLGIALVANATKQTAIGTSATAAVSPFTPLHYALEAFERNVGNITKEVKTYIEINGDDDAKALGEYVRGLKPYGLAANWQDGLDATIIGIKANEAVVQQKKIILKKSLFEIMRGCVILKLSGRVALAFIFGQTLPVHAQTRFSALPNTSSVKVDGTSTLHDWEMEGKLVGGYIEFGSGVTLDAAQATIAGATDGRVPVKVKALIPVESIHSKAETRANVMDHLMQKALKMDNASLIQYNLTEMVLKGPHEANKPFEFDTTGNLAIAGVTNKVSFPVTIDATDAGKLKVKATVPLKMTSYGVDPPAPNIGLGLMRCGDDIKIIIDWTLKVKKTE